MRNYKILIGFIICLSQCFALWGQTLITEKKVLKLMGSRFELTAVAENQSLAWEAINTGVKEIERIEDLISSWDPQSQTSEINRQAGIHGVKVDKELFDLIYRAKKVSALTEGAFDISFASMDRVWKFDGTVQELPVAEKVEKARQYINWNNIELNTVDQSVLLKEKGMKIGFGAIGKGYAANRAKALMQKMKGIHGGLVNAGGDLICWGESNQPSDWSIKITDPKDKTNMLAWLEVKDLAVITSGDYERFFMHNGKRYAHIIDPRTGYPTNGIKSVTIVCPDAELGDALATSVFVLGKENGLSLINQLNGVECLIVTDEDDLLSSDNLQLNHY